MAGTLFDPAALAARVVTAVGLPAADVHGSGAAPRINRAIVVATSAALHLPESETIAPHCVRRFAPVPHPGARPEWFTAQSHVAETVGLRLLRLPGGHLLHLAHAPVVLTAGADRVVGDFSGRYAPLVNHIDVDLVPILRSARKVSGAVLGLEDEISPPNCCHWILDTLPRLKALERLGSRLGAGIVTDKPAERDGRRIYVSRHGSVGRRVINEAALLRTLRKLDIEAVELAGMSVHDQVTLFADATFIIGPRGAGLTNSVFARPNAALLELFPARYGMAPYSVLAMGARLRYAYLITPNVVPGSRPQLDDMRVDIPHVIALCRAMLP